MDKFIVSARKYRPQNFSTVVGQSHITTTLKNAIKNHQLAHAFLFCGPRGVGKTTCARILAKTINCENLQADGEACNQCNSCLSFNEGASLNIHELDAASNNSVDDIRTLVEQVRFAPQSGKYKVYIIDEVHMLSSSAFNAFLKTLEEPPTYAIFILATTEKHKILPTILSRCQIFDFKRITSADTVEHLREICDKEEISAEKASLQVIAQKSEGCMRDALSILDKIVSFTNGALTYQNTLEHLNILDADYYFKLIDAMLGQQLAEAMLLYDDINRKGFEGDLVLNGFAEFMRNLLVCRDEKAAVLLDVVESFKGRYQETAARADNAYLISALNLLNEGEINYRAARNKRLHVELVLIKLCYLMQAMEWTGESGQPAKKKMIESVRPVAFRKIKLVRIKTGTLEPATGEPVSSGMLEQIPEPQVLQPLAAIAGPAEELRTGASATTLGALSKIRQEIARRQAPGEEAGNQPLQDPALREAWKQYTLRLQENRNSALQSFQRALLLIRDQDTFEVITHNNLEQRFIEQEKRGLSDYLKQVLHNQAISFTVTIGTRDPGEEPAEKNLSKREQFQQIVEQYPLVKELKDRLKMELDY